MKLCCCCVVNTYDNKIFTNNCVCLLLHLSFDKIHSQPNFARKVIHFLIKYQLLVEICILKTKEVVDARKNAVILAYLACESCHMFVCRYSRASDASIDLLIRV